MIPEGDGERRRKQREELPERNDASEPHGKRPVGEKKKKKSKGPAVGEIHTKSRTVIPVALNEEEKELQLREALEKSKRERRVTNVPYLEGVGPSGLDLQRQALEKAA